MLSFFTPEGFIFIEVQGEVQMSDVLKLLRLSSHLKDWRADRPDEWKMDEFIRQAEYLENVIRKLREVLNEQPTS